MYSIISSLYTVQDLSLILWEYFWIEMVIVAIHLVYCLFVKNIIMKVVPSAVVLLLLIYGIINKSTIGLLSLLVCAGIGLDFLLAWIIYGIIIVVRPNRKPSSKQKKR